MKMIITYIKKLKLEDVVWALHRIEGLTGLTMSEVCGYGRGKARDAKDKASISSIECVPKVRLEIMCLDELVEDVMQSIQKAAHTGLKGDGKIYVLPVDDALRIRTEERGEQAI